MCCTVGGMTCGGECSGGTLQAMRARPNVPCTANPPELQRVRAVRGLVRVPMSIGADRCDKFMLWRRSSTTRNAIV
jgi:hypothetical protein